MASNLVKSTLVVYIEQAITAVSAFAISALLVRFLSESDYGVYRLVGSVLVFTVYFSSFGLEISIARFVPEFLSKEGFRNVNKLMSGALLIRGIGLLLIFLIFVFFGNLIGDLINARIIFDNFLPLVIPYIFFHLINNIIGRALLTGYSQRHIVGYVNIGSKLLMLVLVGYLFLAEQGLVEVISVLVLITFFEFLFYLPLFISKILRNIKKSNALKEERTLFPVERVTKFSLYNYLFSTGHIFREYAVDSVMIAYFMSTVEVAFYGIATVIPTLVRKFSPSRLLSGVLLPGLVKQFETGRSYKDISRNYILLQKINLIIMLPVIVILYFFVGELILMVYGEAYKTSIQAARILMAFGILHIASDPFYLISQTIERSDIIFYSTIWGLYNLLANFVFIPRYGIEGAALATGSAALGIFIYFTLVYRYLYHIRLSFPWKALGIVLLNMTPIIISIGVIEYLSISFMWATILILFSSIAYLFMLTDNKVFDQGEREFLLSKIKIPVLSYFI